MIAAVKIRVQTRLSVRRLQGRYGTGIEGILNLQTAGEMVTYLVCRNR